MKSLFLIKKNRKKKNFYAYQAGQGVERETPYRVNTLHCEDV